MARLVKFGNETRTFHWKVVVKVTILSFFPSVCLFVFKWYTSKIKGTLFASSSVKLGHVGSVAVKQNIKHKIK